MVAEELARIFTPEKLAGLFPADRSNEFFDALFGDASEGAYDIELNYKGANGDFMEFEFLLKQRPGKCLACNLTYGLPQVFSRHPVINVKKLASDLASEAGLKGDAEWKLGTTKEISRSLHIIPLRIKLN
jgi:hypothetical protein